MIFLEYVGSRACLSAELAGQNRTVSRQAVSYTHLDVYKRQAYIPVALVLFHEKNGFRRVVQLRTDMPSCVFIAFVPVSYTHLDVYKRQGLCK